MVGLFLNDGFEEIEAIAPIDILRRGGLEVCTFSITGREEVTGSHQIPVKADQLFDYDACVEADFDMLVLPGGPGTAGYKQHEELLRLIRHYHEKGKYLAAICAAPTVLGMLGLLEGKRAVCYAGMEDGLTGAVVGSEDVEADGCIITSRGAGTAVSFGLRLLEALKGQEEAERVQKSIML